MKIPCRPQTISNTGQVFGFALFLIHRHRQITRGPLGLDWKSSENAFRLTKSRSAGQTNQTASGFETIQASRCENAANLMSTFVLADVTDEMDEGGKLRGFGEEFLIYLLI